MIVTGGGGYYGYYDSYDDSYYSQYGTAGWTYKYDKAYYPSSDSPCLPEDHECQKQSEITTWVTFGAFVLLICCCYGFGTCCQKCGRCCKNIRQSEAETLTFEDGPEEKKRKNSLGTDSSHSDNAQNYNKDGAVDHRQIELGNIYAGEEVRMAEASKNYMQNLEKKKEEKDL